MSATTKSKELYASEVILRSDVVDLLSTRRELRRARRYRLRYRKPRFNNRIKSKKDKWIAPSIRQKIDFYIRIIGFVYSILPVSKLIIEVAQFDTQKIKNPEISGKEYQEGEQLGFWNVRNMFLRETGINASIVRVSQKILFLMSIILSHARLEEIHLQI